MADHTAYPKRRPVLAPVLAHVPVLQSLAPFQPDPIRYSDFDIGAMTTVVYFPGDPQQVAWDFQEHPRPAARPRGMVRGFRVPAPEPQTVSNLRRGELVSAEGVPEGRLDIFEGVV